MQGTAIWSIVLGFLSGTVMFAQQADAGKPVDSSPHRVEMISVEPDVKLEVLDWGGSGRPVILLAGLGADAHMYDAFAPKLIQKNHVYAITRRGFGASSIPKPNCQNYSAERLGDDVLAVMESLKIEHPVLVGLSVGGEELSSVGSRHPEKVAGLVYLEAGYEYAYYNDKSAQGNPAVDAAELRKELEELVAPYSLKEQKERIEHILKVSMPRVRRDLEQGLKGLQSVPDSVPAPPDNPVMRSMMAVQRSVGIYSGVGIPVLAIYAAPHSNRPQPQADPEKQTEMDAADLARVSEQAKAFEAANPAARVILLPHASHLIIQSNEADVLREMNAFLAKLQ